MGLWETASYAPPRSSSLNPTPVVGRAEHVPGPSVWPPLHLSEAGRCAAARPARSSGTPLAGIQALRLLSQMGPVLTLLNLGLWGINVPGQVRIAGVKTKQAKQDRGTQYCPAPSTGHGGKSSVLNKSIYFWSCFSHRLGVRSCLGLSCVSQSREAPLSSISRPRMAYAFSSSGHTTRMDAASQI